MDYGYYFNENLAFILPANYTNYVWLKGMFKTEKNKDMKSRSYTKNKYMFLL